MDTGNNRLRYFCNRKELPYLQQLLDSEETILAAAIGHYGDKCWLLGCTEKRVLLVNKRWWYKPESREFLLNKIITVESIENHKHGELIIWHNLDKININRITKESLVPFVDNLKEAMHASKSYHNNVSLGLAEGMKRLKKQKAENEI